jgi:two-component system, chemotaxis family, protein-glutamate methylesterase/glutaminase
MARRNTPVPSLAPVGLSPIRTLIVDDSVVFRATLQQMLGGDRDFEVVGVAADGAQAVEAAVRTRPGLVLMDIEMEGRNGLWATEQIMTLAPCAVVVISSLINSSQQHVLFDALRAGAVEVLAKPKNVSQPGVREAFVATLRAMARVKVVRRRGASPPAGPSGVGPSPLVALGASTGGPSALCEVLKELSHDCAAPVVVAQHLANGFTAGLARWLASAVKLKVQVVDSPVLLKPGVVYLPADGHHLELTNGHLTAPAALPSAQAPSVDRLFSSLVAWGPSVIGVLLTGMGSDGARGLLELKHRGCHTVIQDEASSLVYGMPRVAKEMGAASEELPLPIIGARLRQLVSKGRS